MSRRWRKPTAARSSRRSTRAAKAFGMNVTWYPFDGGHDIPIGVIEAVNGFVTGLAP